MQGNARLEVWEYAKPFVIARGVLTDATLLVVELSHDGLVGRGEACPMPYYGETPEGEQAEALEMIAGLAGPQDWLELQHLHPKGAARNAVDCALWDLRAKLAGCTVSELMGRPPLQPVVTAYTLGIDTPEAMGANAREAAERYSLLKIKLGDWENDLDRIRAVRAAAPTQRLIADVNEGWTLEHLREALPILKAYGLELLEQPLPVAQDADMAKVEHIIPIAADESCHTSADLGRITGLFDVVNIKLDKTGGLTEAIRLADLAEVRGMGCMVGCMMATSLGIAPGLVIAQRCTVVDLDAPLMLKGDRDLTLTYEGDRVYPPQPDLWG
ncbi:MAG: dipeptide epimerase [Proteobacteria bacterium]|nr:dipeptide epimerase [Pseudomonadota bacterium]